MDQGNKAYPLTYERMSALSETRPIKQLSAARKSLDFLSRASGSDRGDNEISTNKIFMNADEAYKLSIKNKYDYKQNVFMDIIENIRKAVKLGQVSLIYYGDIHGFCKNDMFQEICLDCSVELTQLGQRQSLKPRRVASGGYTVDTYLENIKGDLLHDHKFHLKINWSKKQSSK
uniref:Uncharacterized protein n=1 Tax=Mimivirus LCMiAC02 TaxID=2506609 RepID=A0A4D5XEP4_9VIRU|nr:MAG: hypothetical protein LCMiAC02_03200 [Mimivirus LCMiAC02]